MHRSTRTFEARYGYDATYLHHLVDTSIGAGLRGAVLPVLSQYRGPAPGHPVWAGASLASVLDGDCGPCVQLVIDLALEAGVDGDALAACVQGAPERAGAVGLGFRFAEAAIRDTPEALELGARIDTEFGPETRIAASFAAATSRAYPVLKRGLGQGAPCIVGDLRFTPRETTAA
jgi:hypothetical protein